MDTLIIKTEPNKTKALIEMFKAFDIAYELNGQYAGNENVLYAEEATNLTPEQIKAIDKALDDVANGRVHTHEEVMKATKLKYPKYFKD
jgi:hypothetical protein